MLLLLLSSRLSGRVVCDVAEGLERVWDRKLPSVWSDLIHIQEQRMRFDVSKAGQLEVQFHIYRILISLQIYISKQTSPYNL